MNQEIGELWVTALESGEHVQGRGQLRSGDSYCCLGVLCALHLKTTGKGQWVEKEYATTNGKQGYSYAAEGDDGMSSQQYYALPIDVQNWAGLDSAEPYIRSADASLTHLNDGPGGEPHLAWTFPQIAAAIRDNLCTEKQPVTEL